MLIIYERAAIKKAKPLLVVSRLMSKEQIERVQKEKGLQTICWNVNRKKIQNSFFARAFEWRNLVQFEAISRHLHRKCVRASG